MGTRTGLGTAAVRLAVAFAFALALVSAFTGGAGAEQMTPAQIKDAFGKGCKEAGNSFVENRDGSYQCNLRDGANIKCTEKAQCTYNPARIVSGSTGMVGDDVVVASVDNQPAKTGGRVITSRATTHKAQLIEAESTPTP